MASRTLDVLTIRPPAALASVGNIEFATYANDEKSWPEIATLVISSGANRMQMWMSADDCRELAKMFNAAAVVLDSQMSEVTA
jgi:hypothetical protein